MFKKIWFQALLLSTLIIAFWHPICFNNELFLDDWSFVDSFKANGFSLNYIFAPNNEHFMPLFKAIFFIFHDFFGTNIIPYMAGSIVLHIINSMLVLILLRNIFSEKRGFFLSIIFALSTTYYEILHWFTNFGQGLTMLALLLTFVFLQKSLKQNSKIFYYLSVASSFFIPMNFSMGFLGIFFITLYLFF